MTLKYTSSSEIDAKYNRVKSGFHSGHTLDLTVRRNQLRNLYYAIVDNEDALKAALKIDLNRSPAETEMLEISLILTEISVAIANLDKWAADTKLSGDLRFALGKSVLRKTPYGTTLVIGPWNYPYLCLFGPLVAVLAAGNTAVVKPTEVATESTKIVTRVLEEALDPSVVQVVVGGVDETTQLLNLKWDKIMLTGSGRVGQIVATAAAKHLTPVTLELGGKSPAVVSKHANVKLAAKRLAWAKFVNAGQTCIAPDYAIVDTEVADEFALAFQEAVKKSYPEAKERGYSTEDDFGHIVTDRLFERAGELVKASKGRVWQWGAPKAATRFYPPTLVRDVKVDDALMRDEIFAPILPVIEIPNAAERAAEIILSGHDHPLAMYIFTSKAKEQEALLAATRSGAVMVNDAVQQGGSAVIPFGGVGPSGTGRYHGKFGFDEFTYERPVIVQPTWVEKLLDARYPPYTKTNSAMLRAVSRPMRVGFPRTGDVKQSRWDKLKSLVCGPKRRIAWVLLLLYLVMRMK